MIWWTSCTMETGSLCQG